ncbi:hypothetical protein CYMTET_9741 [Cymbomonas tetramitiformis]|uniref:Uncharacterized protein n=1 Tax=Cymbomonas tetramitiformis TaxID=36881 RepID=A0AAE0LEU4_9CHLO|nr:hypothetical protein CYMTET_9741 [Cymbomonas tetramitiformis]
MGFALLGTPTQESAGVAGNTPGIGVYFAGWARTTIVLQGTAALPAIAPSMGYAGLAGEAQQQQQAEQGSAGESAGGSQQQQQQPAAEKDGEAQQQQQQAEQGSAGESG